jgi:hypothetical protein
MYEALIEKIRAERVPEGSNYDYIVNGTIDEIIEVIKASEPQWLDSPNEEGWWWFKAPDGHVVCYSVDHCCDNEDGLFAYTQNGMKPIEKFKGKWSYSERKT